MHPSALVTPPTSDADARGPVHRSRALVLRALGLVAVVACAQDPAAPEAMPVGAVSGRLVIVGGALARDNAEVYGAVLDGVGGDGPLCIVPTASGVPD